jgi:hypothetical protein
MATQRRSDRLLAPSRGPCGHIFGASGPSRREEELEAVGDVGGAGRGRIAAPELCVHLHARDERRVCAAGRPGVEVESEAAGAAGRAAGVEQARAAQRRRDAQKAGAERRAVSAAQVAFAIFATRGKLPDDYEVSE